MTMTKAADQLADILHPVTRDLERVTDRLMAYLQNPVARMVAYLVTAGGKRLRPALVLLAGRSGDARACRRQLVDLATAIELVHTATLVHDDIIDESLLRPRQPRELLPQGSREPVGAGRAPVLALKPAHHLDDEPQLIRRKLLRSDCGSLRRF